MRDEYDFSKAVRKNPYLEKMKNGYSVTIHYAPIDNENEKKYKTINEEKSAISTKAHGLASAVSED